MQQGFANRPAHPSQSYVAMLSSDRAGANGVSRFCLTSFSAKPDNPPGVNSKESQGQ
jgi:hypothetical protein